MIKPYYKNKQSELYQCDNLDLLVSIISESKLTEYRRLLNAGRRNIDEVSEVCIELIEIIERQNKIIMEN